MATRLDDLASQVASLDWEQSTADTRYLSHSIHRYSGKFIPQVARQAIELLSSEGEAILDPYCGSGTALLEAALGHRVGIGADRNPLAALIARVKTRPIDGEIVSAFLDEIARTLRAALASQPSLPTRGHESLLESDAIDAIVHESPEWSDPWFVKWYPDHCRRQLLVIRSAIRAIRRGDLRNLATVAFSDILRKTSNAHQGYPNVMFDKKRMSVPEPLPLFLTRLTDIGGRVAMLPSALGDWTSGAAVFVASATALPIGSNTIDAVVTHPPYIGSVPYAEYSALSLRWLGHDEKSLDRVLTGGVRQGRDVVQRFEQGFGLMISESHRVLKPGRGMFMLLGSPVVRGNQVDLPSMAVELAQERRFQVSATATRRGANRRANHMGEEHLLFFTKT